MKLNFSYPLLLFIKYLSICFYSYQTSWLTTKEQVPWQDVKLVVLLNHTSLFEALFLPVAPNHFIKRLAQHLIIPAADTTLARPIVGKLLTRFIPGCVPISRKKDDTWQQYLKQIAEDSIVAIMPEGRMKRTNGLDKDGKPMSIRRGISDILNRITTGQMLIVYSGGLHHIHAPGDRYPRLFKAINCAIETIDISVFKHELKVNYPGLNFQQAVVEELEKKLRQC